MVGLLAIIAWYFFLNPKYRISTKIKISLPLGFAAIFFLINSASQLTARLQTPLMSEMSTAFRFIAWYKGTLDFFSSPILGIGTGSFELVSPWIVFDYPHNLFVEIASENGVLGLVILFAIIILGFRYSFFSIKAFANRQEQTLMWRSITFFAIFLFALWNSMFSGDLALNEIVWFSIGLIYAAYLLCMKRGAK